MIFNKNDNGAQELRELTGSYFANNEFGKIAGIVEQVQDETAAIIGADTMEALEALYLADNDNNHCVMWVRKVIATMATLRLYRSNDLSHEDDGRKFKIDAGNEKIPWEWQLNRDDRIILESHYAALDNLLRNLGESNIASFKQTQSYQISKSLLIRSADQMFFFNGIKDYYVYFTMIPYLLEAQKQVKKAYGEGLDQLTGDNNDGTAHIENEVAYAAAMAESLLASAIMLERQELKLIPYGFVKQVNTEGGMEQNPPSASEVREYGERLRMDAIYWLREMKKLRDIAASTEIYKSTIDDKNDRHNKFFRL